jgi:tetratricopeptide (TPR) repeat protein
VSAAPPSDRQFANDYGAALAALRGGRAAAAETLLRAIQARMPGEVNSLRVLGLALRAQARAPEALAALERAVRLAPDFAHAWEDLGHLYFDLARFEPAEQALKRALALDGSLHRAWRRLGDALVERGNPAQARAAFDRSVATDPERERFAAAAAALARGERHEAEGIFRELLRADEADVGALCGLAALALGAGRPRDAERLLRHALKQVAHLPLVWRGLAQALLDAGRHVEADAAIRRALKVDPDSAASWIIQGSVAAHRLQGEAAVAAFDRARARAEFRRSLLQPRGSQELPVRRRRDRGDGGARGGRAGARAGDGRCGPARVRARPRVRTARRVGEVFPPLCRGQRGAAADAPLRCGRIRGQVAAGGAVLRRRLPEAPCRCRLSRSRADLHRRTAALGLHARRADSREPPEGAGHDGAAESRDDRARTRSLGRRPSRSSGCAISTRRATCAANARVSSTRCRTISVTWGCCS